MPSASVVETARRPLGPVGVYLPIPFAGAPPIDLVVPMPSGSVERDLMTGVGLLERLAPAVSQAR